MKQQRRKPARTLAMALALSSLTTLAKAQEGDGSVINPALAQEAVMEILPAIPAEVGLSPEDYVFGNDYTGDLRSVHVFIGPDGHMMPSEAWRLTHPAQCRKQARETFEPVQILTFEIQRITETLNGLTRHQYFANARLSDIDIGPEKRVMARRSSTGGSTVGRYPTGSGGKLSLADYDALVPAFRDAMQNLGIDFGAPGDGCGDIRLTHLFGTKVDQEFGFLAGYQNESVPNMTYEWEFGGAGEQGDQIGRHVYPAKGTYTVTVHVGGEGVREGSASIVVAVDGGPIQPKDGTWAISLVNHETDGCAPKIVSGIEKAMASMFGDEKRERLTFTEPFHPEPLMKHADKLDWTQRGMNTWDTVIADKSGNAMKQKVDLVAEVLSETRIKEVMDHEIIMSANIANLLGGSERCVAVGTYDLKWVGP
ncbi:PKD domain-containing protein [Celeribacter sp.]|uniref:PKD domain-containing protein n=1 Tax=Celeribacter sp. TaxID=1890673 RepID=UPI003A910479